MPQALTYESYTFLAEALRPGASAAAPPRTAWPVLLQAAHRHGVLPLLAAAAGRAGWDADFVAAMRPAVAAHSALAIVREREARRLLSALEASRVSPLLLKGGHLAYAVYESPALRPRLDTDLLVRDDECDRLRLVLMELGYGPLPHVTGEVAFGQFQYGRTDDSGARHIVDVHRRLANPKAFADRFTYAELSDGAETLAALAPTARGPAPDLALMVACLHRTAHHGTCSRLIWLYDIHLLAMRMKDSDWERIVRTARRKRLTPVVAAGLADAADALGTNLPDDLLQRLHQYDASTDRDVFAFLEGQTALLHVAASDWRRIAGWRDRARFLREHLLPAPSYMRERYGFTSHSALPLVYAHRIVAGALKHARLAILNPPSTNPQSTPRS
ncbi:MAG TPA: nucleotidyltransferase family protein [Vicinamibacterales bacterium]|nr:nucleotidyltransferase family protein [Vicinamibacterales bacterium]